MSNTGTKIVLTLKQVVSGSGIPSGLTKPDLTTDPDYIAPYIDLGACPITFATSCPIVSGTSGSGAIEFEFSLPNSVVNNPAINIVKVLAQTGSIFSTISSSFALPNATPNYFHASMSAITAGVYSLNIQYYSGSSLVRSCSISGAVYSV